VAEARHDVGIVDEAGAFVEVDRGGAFAAGEQVERVDAGQVAGAFDQCGEQDSAGTGAARGGDIWRARMRWVRSASRRGR
jgi:hypothetical protein